MQSCRHLWPRDLSSHPNKLMTPGVKSCLMPVVATSAQLSNNLSMMAMASFMGPDMASLELLPHMVTDTSIFLRMVLTSFASKSSSPQAREFKSLSASENWLVATSSCALPVTWSAANERRCCPTCPKRNARWVGPFSYGTSVTTLIAARNAEGACGNLSEGATAASKRMFVDRSTSMVELMRVSSPKVSSTAPSNFDEISCPAFTGNSMFAPASALRASTKHVHNKSSSHRAQCSSEMFGATPISVNITSAERKERPLTAATTPSSCTRCAKHPATLSETRSES